MRYLLVKRLQNVSSHIVCNYLTLAHRMHSLGPFARCQRSIFRRGCVEVRGKIGGFDGKGAADG